MPDQSPLTAHHWLELSIRERMAAIVLGNSGLWRESFQHAGFAVECALKYRIMRHRRMNA
jgi:hypothetical protein